MSNRHHTSTYHKISITDFFPRIPKLPSDLKLVHWGPSCGSSSTIFFKHSFLCQITTIRVRIIKYQSNIFPKDSKTALGFEIQPLGAELWLFKDSIYFTISNRNRYSKLLTIYSTRVADFKQP